MCNYDQTRGCCGIEERGMRGASRDCQGWGGRGAGPVSVLAAFSLFPSLPPNPQFQKGFQLERGVLLVRCPPGRRAAAVATWSGELG